VECHRESFYSSGKPIALVCHSPGVLRYVTYQGAPLVKGKRVTGFTNGEEEEMHLTKVVPFLVEDELMRLGATVRIGSSSVSVMPAKMMQVPSWPVESRASVAQ
jgi:putative intracellular protease/amidase